MIRDIIVRAYQKKKTSAVLRDLRQVLADNLIPELVNDDRTAQFADLYAQTLTYGLFAAKAHQTHTGGGTFNLHEAAREIPKTNPLLRQLFSAITGPDFDDEPYAGFVHELVAVLDNAAIREILEDFGQAAIRQDPILHFYETFLATYDPELRERRGVYYTPEPVVTYIVRSVDHLLKTQFKIKDGLADRETITYKPPDTHGHPDVAPPTAHRTLILDPATGTGTFLYEVVETIRQRFRKQRRAGFWSQYVHDHLLPRLFGFELLMAPYAVAHLKLGMQLAGQDIPELERELLAYGFETDDRLQVYLTNTLEQVERHSQQAFGSLQRAISEEARQAARVKRDLPILVVLGNPPYSGVSSNQGAWIDGLLKGKLPDGTTTASYYHVDGKPMGERKLWLQDDYVKFIRWAQWRLEQTGQGILAFITNHGYLDNPTFRGMRWSLMQAFDEIYVLDLHGNTKKKEVAPDGSPDQNVFDIQQGVAIGIFIKRAKTSRDRQGAVPATVYHADLWGKRTDKYEWLAEHTVESTEWTEVKPDEPFYLYKPFDRSEVGDYYDWSAINKVMPSNVTGVVTARDSFVIDWDRGVLLERIQCFLADHYSDVEIAQRFKLKENYSWRLNVARRQLREAVSADKLENFVVPILYRPFDSRLIFWEASVVWRMRTQVMPHMLGQDNYALITARSNKFPEPNHFFVGRTLVETKCGEASTQSCTFPLYLYPNVGKVKPAMFDQWPEGKNGRRPNLDPEFVRSLESATGMQFVSDGRGDLDAGGTFGPEDVLAYIYAVFHWPEYRRRYEPMLKLDFPRVPPPENARRFSAFAALGHKLLAAHLLEDDNLTGNTIAYPVQGDNTVAAGYPKYVPPGAAALKVAKHKLQPHDNLGRVYINPEQFFENIEPDVWTFQIGGYQVCEKWLKDRRGRTLTFDDLTHYTRTIEALRQTIALMQQIESAAI